MRLLFWLRYQKGNPINFFFASDKICTKLNKVSMVFCMAIIRLGKWKKKRSLFLSLLFILLLVRSLVVVFQQPNRLFLTVEMLVFEIAIMRLLCAMKISILFNAKKRKKERKRRTYFFLSLCCIRVAEQAICHCNCEKFNCTKGKDAQNIWTKHTHTF